MHTQYAAGGLTMISLQKKGNENYSNRAFYRLAQDAPGLLLILLNDLMPVHFG